MTVLGVDSAYQIKNGVPPFVYGNAANAYFPPGSDIHTQAAAYRCQNLCTTSSSGLEALTNILSFASLAVTGLGLFKSIKDLFGTSKNATDPTGSQGSNQTGTDNTVDTQSGVDSLDAAVTDYQTNGDLKGLQSQIRTQENKHKANITKIANMTKQPQKDYDKAQKALENATAANDKQQAAFDAADKAVKAAETGLPNLKSQYEAADAAYKSNPNDSQAQTNYNTAKKAYDEALKEVDRLKQVREKEQNKLYATGKKVEEATTDFEAKETALNNAKDAQAAAQTENDNLQISIENAKAALPDYANDTNSGKSNNGEVTDKKSETTDNNGTAAVNNQDLLTSTLKLNPLSSSEDSDSPFKLASKELIDRAKSAGVKIDDNQLGLAETELKAKLVEQAKANGILLFGNEKMEDLLNALENKTTLSAVDQEAVDFSLQLSDFNPLTGSFKDLKASLAQAKTFKNIDLPKITTLAELKKAIEDGRKLQSAGVQF